MRIAIEALPGDIEWTTGEIVSALGGHKDIKAVSRVLCGWANSEHVVRVPQGLTETGARTQANIWKRGPKWPPPVR